MNTLSSFNLVKRKRESVEKSMKKQSRKWVKTELEKGGKIYIFFSFFSPPFKGGLEVWENYWKSNKQKQNDRKMGEHFEEKVIEKIRQK